MMVFSLAHELKMTVEQLAKNCTWRELLGWSDFFEERARLERKAQRHQGGSTSGTVDVDIASASDDAIAAMFRANKATRH
jgi:hypothetical protein